MMPGEGLTAGLSRPGDFIETGGFYYFVVRLCPTLREALPTGKVPVVRVGEDHILFIDSNRAVRPLPQEEIQKLRWARGVPCEPFNQ